MPRVFLGIGETTLRAARADSRLKGSPILRHSAGSHQLLQREIEGSIDEPRAIPVFDLSEEALSRFVRTFEKTRFDYVYGYTLSIVHFARYCLKQGIRLIDHCPSLKVCIVTSEVCTLEDRNIIEQAFGIPVVNEYGASELSIMAFEDAEKNWILSEETCYFETTDDGELLATSLFNFAFPIIRYRIGDVAQLSTQRIDGKYQLP